MEQFPETEFIGWVRLVVCIFDQIIYGGDTANTSQTVHNLDAYILILPSVSPKTLPGGRGRVSSTIFSLWLIRRSQTIVYILILVHSGKVVVPAAHLNYTVWDIPMECRRGDVIVSELSGVLHACGTSDHVASSHSSVVCRICTALHWLDIPMIVTFKLCAAFRCLNGSSPPYLVRYFTPVSTI